MSLFKAKESPLTPELQLLRSIPLFQTLKSRELKALEPILHERTYAADEVVFEEGEEGLGMYIILKGQVRISRKALVGRKEVTRLGAGQYFGEFSLLDGVPRSASVIAMEPSRLLGFFRPEFLEILETHDKIGAKLSFQLAKLSAERLRQALNGHVNPDCL